MNKDINEQYIHIIKRLVNKQIINSYGYFDWYLNNYYKEKLPELSNYDFSPYKRYDERYATYEYNYDYDKLPIQIPLKAQEVFHTICKTEILFNEVKSSILNFDICWHCGKEPIGNKNYFIENVAICNDCYNRLNDLKTEFRKYTNNSNNEKSCYIATLAYQDINHPKVEYLRNFRDEVLLQNTIGRKFIQIYYKYSPKIVQKLKPYNSINFIIKGILNCMINAIQLFFISKNKQN